MSSNKFLYGYVLLFDPNSNWSKCYIGGGEIEIKLKQNGTIIYDEADVLINGSGVLNPWNIPDIAGLEAFTGKLVHTAVLLGTKHLIDKLIPKFEIGCRRLSLGDGYLEALQQSNAKWCFEGIEEITKTSIRTAAGEEECDLNVCATGFDTTFVPGWEGRRLDVEWEKVSRGTWQRTQDDQLNC
ncbi:hypothetical protein PCG10_004750 [Penicillium crustosum]|uniref:Uncharacterized protein n=1 Tax=Penicillium crustosum TaxID=36656 RepID=A0A9P5L0Z1_PENCR|nr:hypothetical protein PCG10_004750 [Penicillium crustosum]